MKSDLFLSGISISLNLNIICYNIDTCYKVIVYFVKIERKNNTQKQLTNLFWHSARNWAENLLGFLLVRSRHHIICIHIQEQSLISQIIIAWRVRNRKFIRNGLIFSRRASEKIQKSRLGQKRRLWRRHFFRCRRSQLFLDGICGRKFWWWRHLVDWVERRTRRRATGRKLEKFKYDEKF